jgi:hypothetical protein
MVHNIHKMFKVVTMMHNIRKMFRAVTMVHNIRKMFKVVTMVYNIRKMFKVVTMVYNIRKMFKVVTMVYNIQNQWVSGICLSSGILNTRKHNVSETGSVRFSFRVRGGRHTPLGPLERANPNHQTL